MARDSVKDIYKLNTNNFGIQKIKESTIDESWINDKLLSESWVIGKLLSLISGQDSRPLFSISASPDEKQKIGVFPTVVAVSMPIKIPHVSSKAVMSVVYKFLRSGSAVHLLYRLQDAIEYARIYESNCIGSEKLLAHSLSVLMGSVDQSVDRYHLYHWNWEDEMEGFCYALKVILDDWRFIMFHLHRDHFRALQKEFALCQSFKRETCNSAGEAYLQSNKNTNCPKYRGYTSPLMMLYGERLNKANHEAGDFSHNNGNIAQSKELNISLFNLNGYLLPFFRCIESLTDLIELFLNLVFIKRIDRFYMANVMTTLLLLRIRSAELTGDLDLVAFWKFILYYTSGSFCKNKRPTFSDYKEDSNGWSCIFRQFDYKFNEIHKMENVIHLFDRYETPGYERPNCVDYLSKEMICDHTADNSTEILLLENLDYRIYNYLGRCSDSIKLKLDDKFRFNHYLWLLNGIALLQFGDFIDPLSDMLFNFGPTNGYWGVQPDEVLFVTTSAWVKHNPSNILASLSEDALLKLTKSLKIEVGRNILFAGHSNNGPNYINFMLSASLEWPMNIFLTPESMNMYSAIFIHLMEFNMFSKHTLAAMLMHMRNDNALLGYHFSKVILLLIHLSNSFKSYFSWIIQWSWKEFQRRVNRCSSMQGIQMLHRRYLIFLGQALLLPVDSLSFGHQFKIGPYLSQPIATFLRTAKLLSSMSHSPQDIRLIKQIYRDLSASVYVLKGILNVICGFDVSGGSVKLDTEEVEVLCKLLESKMVVESEISGAISILKNMLFFNC